MATIGSVPLLPTASDGCTGAHGVIEDGLQHVVCQGAGRSCWTARSNGGLFRYENNCLRLLIQVATLRSHA
jgi:hypothetical protein